MPIRVKAVDLPKKTSQCKHIKPLKFFDLFLKHLLGITLMVQFCNDQAGDDFSFICTGLINARYDFNTPFLSLFFK